MQMELLRNISISMILSIFSFGANAKVATKLLDAFSGQCPRVNNVIIDRAKGNLLTLQQVILDLQSDPECGALAYNLNNISILANNITDYRLDQSKKLDLISEQKKLAFYNSLLVDNSFGDMSYDIKSRIINSQASVISVQDEIGYYTSAKNRHAQNAMLAVSGIVDYMRQIQATPGCFESNSMRLSSLIGQTLSISSLFMSPGAAVATSAAGVLSQGIGAFIRNYKYNKLSDAYDKQQMGLAVECTLTALTNQYCEAENAMTLIKAREEDRKRFDIFFDPNKGKKPASLKGIELLSKHLDNLDSWLVEVYAGSPISSEGDRINREKPIDQKNLLEEIERSIDAFEVSQNEKLKILISSGPSAVQVKEFILQSINKLNEKLIFQEYEMRGVPKVENPVLANNDQHTIPFFLFTDSMKRPFCGEGGSRRLCGSLADWLAENSSIPVTVDSWKNSVLRSKKLLKKEMNLVLLLLARVQNVSPIETLTNVSVKKHRRTSPYEALIKIRDNASRISNYLEEKYLFSENFIYKAQRFKVDLTLLKTEKVIDLVEQGLMIEMSTDIRLPKECLADEIKDKTDYGLLNPDIDTGSIKEAAYKISGCINKLLMLTERGSSAYFDEIKSMVRYEIDAKLEGKELDDDLDEFIYMSRGDVVDSLLSTYGVDSAQNMDDIMNSLLTAQEMTVMALDNFYTKFSRHVADVIQDKDTSKRLKNRLCIWALSKPEMKSGFLGIGKKKKKKTRKEKKQIKRLRDIANETCSTAFIKSFYGEELSYRTLSKKSYKERACGFWKYHRKNDLHALRVQ